MRTSIITPPCPAGGGGKAVIPCRYCGAPRRYAPRVLTACFFYPHGLFVRRRKPLTAKITQPYPAGALRKAARAAVFTSSLPNAVWQLHTSCAAAPKRLSCRCGHTALVHNRSGMLAQAAEKLSYLAGIAVRRDILPTGTDCALFLPARYSSAINRKLSGLYGISGLLPDRQSSAETLVRSDTLTRHKSCHALPVVRRKFCIASHA